MIATASKQLIEAWVDAFNRADAQLLASLYAEGATNHLMMQQPVIGRSNIREAFQQEFEEAQMFCIIEKIEGENHWATLEWKDPNGLKGHGYFEIKDEKIVFQRGYWDKLSFLHFHSPNQSRN